MLVLSSLVWKNTLVQNQIRPLGGIEAVLNCCSYDEHNPYIREHAIMCLRFLMEGNRENQERIRALETYSEMKDGKKGMTPVEQSLRDKMEKAGTTGIPVNVKVPDEVLDQQGYETYMDGKGQVMLRKRQPQPQPTSAATGGSLQSVHPAQGNGQGSAGLPQQQPLPHFRPFANEAEAALEASRAHSTPSATLGSAQAATALNSANQARLQSVLDKLPNASPEKKAELVEATQKAAGAFAQATLNGTSPKALEELVQQVMRDLPGGERIVREEALKKLDRGFDGSGAGNGKGSEGTK